nr:nuclear transport factor 2 family protein [Rhodococcus sp. (in: high G+C Gram-positive bacteria)]
MNDRSIETSPDSVVAEILTREQERIGAMKVGRTTYLESFYDDRLSYTHANGWRDDKKTLLGRMSDDGLVYEEIVHRIEHTHVLGAVALLAGRMHAKVSMRGLRRELDSLTSSVWTWSRSEGRWTMLSFHSCSAESL